MRTKKCKRCGAIFETDKQGAYMCPACAKTIKISAVVRPRTCTACGTRFPGGPRAKYCPECRRERAKELDRRQKRQGAKRPLGSIDYCQVCGAEYVVEGGLQRYCKQCAEEAVKASVRPQKRAYNQENKDALYDHKRQMRRYNKVCVICGAVFDTNSPTVTCSAECARIRAAQLQKEADVRRGRLDGSKPRLEDHQSGIPGITWHKGTGKWQLKFNGKYIGLYKNVEDAKTKILEIRKEGEDGAI